jgi:hypothetical protein
MLQHHALLISLSPFHILSKFFQLPPHAPAIPLFPSKAEEEVQGWLCLVIHTSYSPCHVLSPLNFSRATNLPSILLMDEDITFLVTLVLNMWRKMTDAIAPWFQNLASMNSFFTL